MEETPETPARDAARSPQPTAHDLVMARFEARRRQVLTVFLATLLVLVLARLVAGPHAVDAPGRYLYAFPVVIIAILATGLVLNHRGRSAAAVWLVTAAFLVALNASRLAPAGSLLTPYHLFIPLALAGLTLGRRGLVITAAASLATVWLAPFVATLGPGAQPGLDAPTPGTGDGLQLGSQFGSVWLGRASALDFSVVYVAIVVLLERFGITLRWALLRAAAHESALRVQALEARADLEAQRELNEAIRDSFPGAYYVVDEAGRFVQWNKNVLDLLGVSEAELRRSHALSLVAPEDREAARGAMAEALESGSASFQVRVLSRDGHHVPLYVVAARVRSRGDRFLAGVGIDRRELDAAHARIDALNAVLRERLHALSAVHAIDAAIAKAGDLRETLGLILEVALDRLHLDAGNVLLYSAEKERLVFGARRGFRDSEWRPVSVPVGHGLMGRCVEQRAVIVLRGSDEIARRLWRHYQYAREGFESYVAVPLVANEELVGALELFTRRRIAPDDEWHEFLQTVAAQAAIAIAKANLIAGLKRSHDELTLSYDRTIEGWARALDLKDQETEGHSRRVTELSVALAARLGIRGEELMHVRRGALLHDIGKMGVPDAILLKPGKLDREEWEVMKRHTTHGYELLKPIPFLWPALEIPYLHHERWDGTGYPLGLKGDEIPRAARIFAIVDVYDALTNDRPYRPAWSREEALAYIASQAGRQFDPAIAAEFLRMMGADRSGRPAGQRPAEGKREVAPVGAPPRG
jgi:PAS domain S-box-containing protein/putative nucleotidyltransferase with HDIG domain